MLASPMRAEIAGAGFAGLVAGLGLARNGWRVRVHERGPAVRSEGFSIAFHENGLRVFEALGLLDRVMERAHLVQRRETSNQAVQVNFQTSHRTVRVPREHVIHVLADSLQAQGGEIRCGSEAVGADPDGTLILASGERIAADLVVAADGINSRLRDSLGLVRRRWKLDEGGTRFLVPRRAGAPWDRNDTGVELWSGRRRLMIRPTGPNEHYITVACAASDTVGRRVPLDIEDWARSFPDYREFLEFVRDQADWHRVQWAQFELITLKRWSQGRIAVVGDAAHAMPPNLGQGGGCAVVNAFALAGHLAHADPVEEALSRWEARVRPLTAHTQLWSWAWGLPLRFPGWLRASALALAGRSRWVEKQLQRAALHEPRIWAAP